MSSLGSAGAGCNAIWWLLLLLLLILLDDLFRVEFWDGAGDDVTLVLELLLSLLWFKGGLAFVLN